MALFSEIFFLLGTQMGTPDVSAGDNLDKFSSSVIRVKRDLVDISGDSLSQFGQGLSSEGCDSTPINFGINPNREAIMSEIWKYVDEFSRNIGRQQGYYEARLNEFADGLRLKLRTLGPNFREGRKKLGPLVREIKGRYRKQMKKLKRNLLRRLEVRAKEWVEELNSLPANANVYSEINRLMGEFNRKARQDEEELIRHTNNGISDLKGAFDKLMITDISSAIVDEVSPDYFLTSLGRDIIVSDIDLQIKFMEAFAVSDHCQGLGLEKCWTNDRFIVELRSLLGWTRLFDEWLVKNNGVPGGTRENLIDQANGKFLKLMEQYSGTRGKCLIKLWEKYVLRFSREFNNSLYSQQKKILSEEEGESSL